MRLLRAIKLWVAFVGLFFCFVPPAPVCGQQDAMEKAASKLLDTAEKCEGKQLTTYLCEVEANLNAGRFKEALLLMRMRDDSPDALPVLNIAIRKYARAMAKSGRADVVEEEISVLEHDPRVKRWLAIDPTRTFKSLWQRERERGSVLFDASQGNFDSVMSGKATFDRMMDHLVAEGDVEAAVEAAKIRVGDDVDNIHSALHLLWGELDEFDVAMVRQHPGLAAKVVATWGRDKVKSNALQWEAFQKIDAIVSPEVREVIEVEAVAGDFLPEERRDRVVARFLKQIPAEEIKSPTLRGQVMNVFDHLLRHNKLVEARQLFDSAPAELLAYRGMQLAEQLSYAGKHQAAKEVMGQVFQAYEEDPLWANDFSSADDWERALKIGQVDGAAKFVERVDSGEYRSVVVETHRKVRDAGFTSAESVAKPLKAGWERLVELVDQNLAQRLNKARIALLWEHLVAELAIRHDARVAHEATMMLPKSIVGDPIEVGRVIKVLCLRGYDQKAVEYAKTWRDAPETSLQLGFGFFYSESFDVNEMIFQPNPETEREIFQAIGDQLSSDRFYLEHRMKAAIERKDKEEALRFAKLGLVHGWTCCSDFVRVSWHEDLTDLAKATCDPEGVDDVVDGISEALFEARRVDDLISYFEKYVPLHNRDGPGRATLLFRYARRTSEWVP